MVFSKEKVLAGIFLALSATVSAQTHFHGAWSVGSKYAISSYNFSANQSLFALMPTAQGEVKYASFYLSQPSNKCFIIKTMPWGSTMDTKIWSNDGAEAYSDDYQGGTSRYAEFLWWSSANPIRFR